MHYHKPNFKKTKQGKSAFQLLNCYYINLLYDNMELRGIVTNVSLCKYFNLTKVYLTGAFLLSFRARLHSWMLLCSKPSSQR